MLWSHEVPWGYCEIFLTVTGPHEFRLSVKYFCQVSILCELPTPLQHDGNQRVVTSQINTSWSFSRVLRSLDGSCCHLLSLCTSLECEFTGSSVSIYHARAANCLCKCSRRVQCSDTVPSATEPGIRKHTHRSTHGWSPPAKTVPQPPQKNTNISVENPERRGNKNCPWTGWNLEQNPAFMARPNWVCYREKKRGGKEENIYHTSYLQYIVKANNEKFRCSM